ncbi:unnamed protein product, partial [Prorocentrum cordatum]
TRPFDAGNPAGPSPAAKPGLHSTLSPAALLGSSWCPAPGEEEGRSPGEGAGAPPKSCRAGAGVAGAAAESEVPDWELAHAEAFDFWHPAAQGAAAKQGTFFFNVWTDA